MRKVLLILALFTHAALQAQNKTKTFFYDEAEAVPREHNIDITNVLIDVQFDAPKGMVKGKVTHSFLALRSQVDTLFFDAPGITILEASLDGKSARFMTSSKGVTVWAQPSIAWDVPHKISFTYEAQPRLGLYFIGWNDPENKSRKQVWTQGQAYDNRYWVPLYDKQNDKAITEVIVRFDAAYKVLSNGEKLMERDNKDGTITWHYKMTKPHATYLIMLGIGKYEIQKRKSQSGVPLSLWYYPEFKERVEWTYQYSAEMVDWLEKELGVKYPWTTYAQIPVQDYTFGAMENTTATLFGDFFLVDEGGALDKPYLYVNAHELTHMWFGDLVTERSETHHWLQESFATFYGYLYYGAVKGQDFYDWSRKVSIDQSLEASKKDLYPIVSSVAGTTRHYPKGAVVLDMLRYVTGEEEFRRAIKHYLEKHGYGNVDTEDLLTAFHEKLGMSLDWFWEQWLYRGGEPRYEVSFRTLASNLGEGFSEFTITQSHEVNDLVGYFKMPINFEVHYKDGTSDSKQAWISQFQQTVLLPNPQKKAVDFVLFDPDMKVVKSVNFVKSTEMLLAQARKAKKMLDRYDAWVALRNVPLSLKANQLHEAFDQEKFYAIKTEALSQLSLQEDERTLSLFKKALEDKDVEVRKGVLANVKKIPPSLQADFEKLLTDKSYQVVEQALEKLSSSFPDKITSYLDLTKNVDGVRANNVKIKWLEIASQKDLQGNAKMLEKYAGPSYEFLTRSGAITTLKKLNYLDETGVRNLFDALLNPNYKLSNDAAAALKYFYAQIAYKKMIVDYYEANQWNLWQKELIAKIFM